MSDPKWCNCEGVRCSFCDEQDARLRAEVEALRKGGEGLMDDAAAAMARALAAERARDEAVAALREIVTGWGEDEQTPGWSLDDAIARARAVLEGKA